MSELLYSVDVISKFGLGQRMSASCTRHWGVCSGCTIEVAGVRGIVSYFDSGGLFFTRSTREAFSHASTRLNTEGRLSGVGGVMQDGAVKV